METQKKSISELLQAAKELKRQEAEIKSKMKAQKHILATEYADNMSDEAKRQQIAEAEKILNTAKTQYAALKEEFKARAKKIKEEVSFAKEILAFVHYKQAHSLPKAKNMFSISGTALTFKREGLKDITVDISKADWQRVFKDALKAQGLTDQDRTADNIVYKAGQLVKSNITI